MKLTSVEIHPKPFSVQAPDVEDVSEIKFVSVPNTPGPHFIFGSYNAVTDTFKIYEDGVLVSTQTGLGHTSIYVPFNRIIVGGAPLTGSNIYDEIAFGAGVVSDAVVAALYADASDYDVYSASQLALNPFVYYHLNSSAGVDLTDSSGNGLDLSEYISGSNTAESSLIAGTHGAVGVPVGGGNAGLWVYPSGSPLTILNGSWWICGWVGSVDGYLNLMQIETDGGLNSGIGIQPDVPGVSHFISLIRLYAFGSGPVTTPNASPIVLSFRDPRASNPYNAVSIDGLDTDLIIPKYYGTDEDSKLYNLVRKKRNIIIQAGLNPDYSDLETYSKLRDDLYRIISATRSGEVQLRFKNDDDVIAAIFGFVLKFETDIFEQKQEAKMTLECRDPMLKSLTRVPVNVTLLNPTNSIIQDDKSTAPHGFMFVIKFLREVGGFSINREELGATFTIRPRGGFHKNDLLHMSSEFDNRSVYLVRGSTIIHLADVIDQFSIWPLIYPGENIFQLTPEDALQWKSILHYETYWGV